MLRKNAVLIVILICLAQLAAYAGDKFELTIQVAEKTVIGGDRTYRSPRNNTIKVNRGDTSIRFKVVLKNISSDSQSLSIGSGWGGSDYGGASGMGLITFEITDDKGNNNVVTKEMDVKSSKESYVYLGPGKSKEFEILLAPTEWSNAFKLRDQGATQARARASYKSGSTVIYSDYYTILLND